MYSTIVLVVFHSSYNKCELNYLKKVQNKKKIEKWEKFIQQYMSKEKGKKRKSKLDIQSSSNSEVHNLVSITIFQILVRRTQNIKKSPTLLFEIT